MKRSMPMVLIGALLLIPAGGAAQRARHASAHVVAPEYSARLAPCRAPADGRSYVCRAVPSSRVVYRYAGPPRTVPARPIAARVWVRPTWTDVRIDFGWRRGARYGVVDQRWLRNVVGDHTLRRVRDHGHDAGLRGPVRGHWVERLRSDVLVLTMDGEEVARLVDRDRDGRVDVFLLRNFHRR